MSTVYNEIYLQKSLKWMIKPSKHQLPLSYLASAIKNIEGLGFTFSQALIDVLSTLETEHFVATYQAIEAQLKMMVTADHVYKPMYPRFPEQVMAMSEAELYINALIHYYTLLLPEDFIQVKSQGIKPSASANQAGQVIDLNRLERFYETMKAMIAEYPSLSLGDNEYIELITNVKEKFLNLLPNQTTTIQSDSDNNSTFTTIPLRVIDLGHLEQFYVTIQNMISAPTSISQADKDLLELVVVSEENIKQLLPEEIPLKENVAFISGLLLKYGKADVAYIGRYFKTATDVLRLAVALSDGDISLADNTVFRKFKRAERRLLLALLNQCNNPVEDMLRYKERWIRLGEIIHPTEYKNKYSQSAEAFDMIRNGHTFITFRSQVEQALRFNNTSVAADLLAQRPGEFARRLDHLLRTHHDPDEITIMFSLIIEEVSTPVLLQVMTHFKHRNEAHKWRTFFLKGNVGKAIAIPNTLPKLAKRVCLDVAQICEQELVERFSKLPALGKVYIEDSLQKHHVPFAMRSASKALRTLSRGSRIAMPEGDTIRFFLWWKEGTVNGVPTDRVDIDLSATMYNSNWEYMEHISYTNLRSAQYKAFHSGDIVSAPKGACEFIDIDIESVLRYGGRYVVSYLNSFTLQPFCNLPECFAGWMMRSKPGSKEVFDPKTVVDCIDLAADTQIAIPVILDLREREVIWCDLALRRHPAYNNNVEGNLSGMVAIGQAMTSVIKPNLYDLFSLHAKARGEITGDIGEADSIFSLENGVTPFDISTIVGEYM